MACCAFVAFLLSQGYLMAEALMRWMRGAPQSRVPSAVMWRLDATGAEKEQPVSLARPFPRAKRRALGLISLAAAAELAILIGGVHWLTGGGAQALMLDAQRLASVRSFADLQIICTAKR
jgi:hypothetical protein